MIKEGDEFRFSRPAISVVQSERGDQTIEHLMLGLVDDGEEPGEVRHIAAFGLSAGFEMVQLVLDGIRKLRERDPVATRVAIDKMIEAHCTCPKCTYLSRELGDLIARTAPANSCERHGLAILADGGGCALCEGRTLQ